MRKKNPKTLESSNTVNTQNAAHWHNPAKHFLSCSAILYFAAALWCNLLQLTTYQS